MAEIFVIVSAAVMVGGSWFTYGWARKAVQRLNNKRYAAPALHAMLAMCVYVTALPAITFGGGNYWLAGMISIPFTIVMAVWLAHIASLVIKRRSPAMTQDVPGVPEGVRVRTTPRTVPQAVPVEAFSAGGGKRNGRGPRASRIIREVEA
jgi:hypothetical protein